MLSVAWSTSLQAINWAESNGIVRASVQWESEYIFRGIKQGGGTLIPSAGVSLFGFYADAEWFQPIQHKNDPTQWNGYLGYRTEVSPFFFPNSVPDLALEAGMVYRHYSDSSISNSREFYAGLEFQGLGTSLLLSHFYPRFHLLYDIDRFNGTLTAQGSIGYDLYLDTDWPIWLYFEPFFGWSNPSIGEKWFFYGIQADLKYAILPGLVASAGVRYSGKSVNNVYLGEDSSHIWWGTSVRFEF
jgi:hypothetical protein